MAETTKVGQLLSHFAEGMSSRARQTLQLVLGTEKQATWALRLLPASALFDEAEQELIRQFADAPAPTSKSVRAQTVIILKATRLCNLRCTYCNSWRDGPDNIMPFCVLAKLTRDVLRAPGIRKVDFVWHGGEVTLLPIKYIKRALWLQQYFSRPETQIGNSIQTNATRLTDEWIELFQEYGFSIGVSIDGPSEYHDARRLTVSGKGSWQDVSKGINRLKQANMSFGALAVVDECVVHCGAKRYLQYLVDVGVRAVALLNALPPNAGEQEGKTYFPLPSYTEFLRELFAVWWNHFRHIIVIRELEALVESVTTGYTPLCVFRENCMGQYLTIEPNGEVSACDKYVGDPNYIFGSLESHTLSELLETSMLLDEARKQVDKSKEAMTECVNYKYCTGGCPHDTRLTMQFNPGASLACCGLSHLIEDIRTAVGK